MSLFALGDDVSFSDLLNSSTGQQVVGKVTELGQNTADKLLGKIFGNNSSAQVPAPQEKAPTIVYQESSSGISNYLWYGLGAVAVLGMFFFIRRK